MRVGAEEARARGRVISGGVGRAGDASAAASDAIEVLEIELGEARNALERLEASCEALEEAVREDARDKECAEALRENARTISTLQARVYGLTLEIERRRGNVGGEDAADADEGAWV